MRRGRQLRRRDPRRPLDRSTPATSSRPTSLGTFVLLEAARATPASALPPGLTDEVYGACRGRAQSRPTRWPSQPVLGAQGRRRPAVARATSETYGVPRRDHARRQQLRAVPVPGEAHPALHHQRPRRPAAAASTATAAAPRLAPRRRPLRGGRLVLREGGRARSTTSAAATSSTNIESHHRILELTGAGATDPLRRRTAPATTGVIPSTTRSSRALGWSPQAPSRTGLAETVAWYQDNRAWWEPIKSGDTGATTSSSTALVSVESL